MAAGSGRPRAEDGGDGAGSSFGADVDISSEVPEMTGRDLV